MVVISTRHSKRPARAFQEPTGRRCQINSTVCIFPLTRVGGVTNVI
jgi:hypothetical protein